MQTGRGRRWGGVAALAVVMAMAPGCDTDPGALRSRVAPEVLEEAEARLRRTPPMADVERIEAIVCEVSTLHRAGEGLHEGQVRCEVRAEVAPSGFDRLAKREGPVLSATTRAPVRIRGGLDDYLVEFDDFTIQASTP